MKSLELRGLEFVILDLETTGLYPESGDEIIEIGALVVSNLEITEKKFHSMINPGKPIPAVSTSISGIKDSDVKNAPKIDDMIHKFCEFVGGRVMVAHNAKFDMGFILRVFQRCNIPAKSNVIIDTLAISRILSPYESSHSLDSIMSRLGIARTGERHRSIDDCRYTALALIEFIKLLEKQGTGNLTDIQDAFIKPESILKAEKPKNRSLFG